MRPSHAFASSLIAGFAFAADAGDFPSPFDFFRNGPQYAEVYSAQSRPSPFDASKPLEARARAYLDLHCSVCHQPGGVLQGRMDLRFSAPLAKTGLFAASGRRGPHGFLPRLSPGKPDASEIYRRLGSLGSDAMPPMGRTSLDERGLALIRAWIVSLSSVADMAPAAPPQSAPTPTRPHANERSSDTSITMTTEFGDMRIPVIRTGPSTDLSAELSICEPDARCEAADIMPSDGDTTGRSWVLRPASPRSRGYYWLLIHRPGHTSRYRLLVL